MEKDPLLSTVRRGTGTDVEESPFVDQLYATSEPRPRRRAILAAGINIARLILVLLLLVFVADKIWNYVEDEGASTTNLTDDLLEDSGDSGIEISATDDGGDDGSCGYEDYTCGDDECNLATSPVLGGVDVVAYFADGASTATLGSSEHAASYRGYDFYFASAANAEAFALDPSAYAPQYGGFCAFGLSGEDPMNTVTAQDQLYTVPADPDVFALTADGKLYMFRGEGAKDLWLEDEAALVLGADVLWASWFGEGCEGFYNTLCFHDWP